MTEPYAGYDGLVYLDSFGPSAFHMRARTEGLRDFGACMSPQNAFYILQGVETLPLRIERHIANTQAIVAFLAGHDAVAYVVHPSLAGHADHRLAKKLLPKGAGSMVSFGVKGGRDAGRRFIEACQLASHLANVGDAKTLVIHPASTTHLQVGAEGLAAAGVGEDMIRLSVGLEDLAGHHRRSRPRPAPARSGPRAMDLHLDAARVFLADQGRRFDPGKPTLLFCTAPAWITRSGRCRRAISPIAAGMRWPSTCRAMAAATATLLTSIEAMADWLARLIDALGIARAAVVGHSMGALVALACAARAPQKVERIALLGRSAGHAGASGAARGGGKARAARAQDDLRLGLRPRRPLRRPPLARQLDAGPRAGPARPLGRAAPAHRPRRLQRLCAAASTMPAEGRLPGPGRRRRARPHDARQARREARRRDRGRPPRLPAALAAI